VKPRPGDRDIIGRSLLSLRRLNRDPHPRPSVQPLSRGLREKLKDHTPELAAGVLAVERRKSNDLREMEVHGKIDEADVGQLKVVDITDEG
jgi:hypothetical protein